MKKKLIALFLDNRSVPVFADRIIRFCLFVIVGGMPLVVIPYGREYWYWPKISTVYLLLVVIITALVWRGGSIKRVLFHCSKNPLTVPLLAYGASGLLSVVFSISPLLSIFGDEYREEGVFTIVSYILLTFLFAELNRTRAQLLQLMRALLGCCVVVSIFALCQYFGFDPIGNPFVSEHDEAGRVGSTIGNPNFLGKYLVLVLPIMLTFFFNAVSRHAKYFFGAGAAVAGIALILTFTRASWFGFAVSAVVFVAALGRGGRRTLRKKMAAVAIVLIVCAASFEGVSQLRQAQQSERAVATLSDKVSSALDFSRPGGMSGRLFAWQKAMVMIRERPLLGYGLDTHMLVMSQFSIEYIAKYNDHVLIDRVHNNYLDIALPQGLVGLAAYLAIVMTFMVWLMRTLQAESVISQRILYCGIFASFCGYLVNDFFIFSVVSVSPIFWSLMGITIAMKKADSGESGQVECSC